MTPHSTNGIVHLATQRTVAQVLDKLLSLLRAKGMTLFVVIDHGGEAAKAGLTMPDTRVVIFGNPAAGTPIMQASPDCALDLPLRILLAEQPDGTATVAYNSVSYLQTRYSLEPDLAGRISGIDQIALAITQ